MLIYVVIHSKGIIEDKKWYLQKSSIVCLTEKESEAFTFARSYAGKILEEDDQLRLQVWSTDVGYVQTWSWIDEEQDMVLIDNHRPIEEGAT